MGDKALRGNKLTRIGFKQGGAYGPLRGTTAGGVAKAFRGPSGFKESQALQKKIIRPTKDTGLHKGSTRSDTSPIGMGKLKTPTKQDYILKNQLKKVQKMPDKKFKSQNPATEKVKSDRTGKVHEVRKKDLVKGSLGKKTYKQDMKYYHHWRHPKGE